MLTCAHSILPGSGHRIHDVYPRYQELRTSTIQRETPAALAVKFYRIFREMQRVEPNLKSKARPPLRTAPAVEVGPSTPNARSDWPSSARSPTMSRQDGGAMRVCGGTTRSTRQLVRNM